MSSQKPTLPWINSLSGRFVAFEGPDGSGKSTQLRRFIALAKSAGLAVTEVREPGGTPIGEQIRAILLDNKSEMVMPCELLLYMASRAQLVHSVIRPALERRELVVADRFVASTYAYQGHAGGLPIDNIRAAANVATGGTLPDLNIIFDVSARAAAARLSPLLDRIESRGEQYHARVRAGYQSLARDDPQHHLLVPADDDEETVWRRLLQLLEERLRA